MKHMVAALLMVGLAVGGLVGCASDAARGEVATVPLEGSRWRLVSIQAKQAAEPSGDRRSEFRLDASEQRFTAMVGVNNLGGTYERTGGAARGTIRFPEQIVSTRMAGPPELMGQDGEFTRTLPTVDSYDIAGDRLTFLSGGRAVLVFQMDK